MNALALIQARLGSSRLPGKSGLPLPFSAIHDSHTMLGHIVSRARRAASIGQIIIATTTRPLDDKLAALAWRLGAAVYRGDEEDVLSRFAGALDLATINPTAIVRLTADNPAIDPSSIDKAVAHHLATSADYTHTTGLPLGTNLEIINPTALCRAHAEAHQSDEREHVTPYLRYHPELFRLEALHFTVSPTVASLRLTVDYASDYALLHILYEALGSDFVLADLPALLAKCPWLLDINRGNVQR